MRKRPLLLCACVFVLGLLYESWPGRQILILFGIIAIYAGLPLFGARHYIRGVLRCIWIGAAFWLGILHVQSQNAFREAELAQVRDGETITLCGEIYKKEIKNDQLLVYLKNCYAVSNNKQIACNQVLLYQTSDDFSIGDILLLNGQVNMFQSATNDGMFDSKGYYFSQKIDFAVKQAEVSLGKAAKNPLPEALWHLRRNVAAFYSEATDAITAGVLSVMILGDKSTLDTDVRELYQSMGISHILAISGLHVSLIGLLIYRFLRKRGIRCLIAFPLSSALLFFYAMMTGCSVSTKRAVGMLFFLMLGDLWGRAYDSLNALGGMVLYLLWQNPFLLNYAGFTLSVAAVIGVATVASAIQINAGEVLPDMIRLSVRTDEEGGTDETGQNGNSDGNKTGIKAMIAKQKNAGQGKKSGSAGLAQKIINAAYTGVGIWLFTLPLIAYYYYEIPLYSALLNLFVVPLLKFLILLGIAGAAVALMGSYFFAQLLGIGTEGMCYEAGAWILAPCGWILNWYDFAATACQSLPLAQVIVGQPKVVRMILFYLVLSVFAWIWSKRKSSHPARLCGVAATFFVLAASSGTSFELDVLDVGQGDGTYLCTAEGVSLFIDGGSTNVSSVGTYRILPFLKSKGIKKVSYWFVSHADADHISGLTEVLESGYPVDNLVLSYRTAEDESRAALIASAEAAGCNILCMKTGDALCMEETTITCLSPDYDNTYEDRNDGGLVLLYRDGSFSGVFAGDIPSEVEEEIVLKYVKSKASVGQAQTTGIDLLDVDFYKVDHHGSRYSSGEEWLSALSPMIATISCSSTNNYGHPHEETLARLTSAGSEIYRTDELGEITLTIEDGELAVTYFRDE